MVQAIPTPIKNIWDGWSIRTSLIFSLSLQAFLIISAPQRKRSSRKILLSLIWSAYLLADWAANFAAGQISDSQGNDLKPGDPVDNADLQAFWVPFFLLHLGGPDTITALALEDNELWLRHLIGLAFQAVATGYVFLQSLPNDLWRPLILVFTAGVIKYIERTLSLYLASLDKFKDSMIQRPDPGPNYAKLMEEYKAKKDMKVPTQIIKVEDPDKDPKASADIRPKDFTHLNILQYAYKYFNIFKGLVVDLIFTFQERAESQRFFSSLKANEALMILEVELNFIYEALFTKAEILHNLIGIAFRFIALGCLSAALRLFVVQKKHNFDGFDVGLTYALLLGGIALDSIALIMFCFSDWTFVRLKKMKDEVDDPDTWVDHLFNWILKWILGREEDEVFRDVEVKTEGGEVVKTRKRIKWVAGVRTEKFKCLNNKKKNKQTREVKGVENVDEIEHSHGVFDTRYLVRRWSEYVHGHNLIEYCLWIRPKPIHNTKGFVHILFDGFIKYSGIGPLFKLFGSMIASCYRVVKYVFNFINTWIDHLTTQLHKNHKRSEEYLRLSFYITFYIPSLPGRGIKMLLDFFGVQAQIEDMIFTSSDRLTLDMWEHIFGEVLRKSRFADDSESAMRVSSARGDWTIRDIPGEGDKADKKRDKLLRYVMEMDYDQSLLVWHISTELLYQTKVATKDNHSFREFSKILSDYMMYLLIRQPTLMTAVVGIGKIRFRDTCEEANRFFQRRHITDKKVTDAKKACEAILSVVAPGKAEPMDVKGDRSKSVLFDGSMLAKELLGLIKDGDVRGDADMWEVVSKVWVELLCYAATKCGAIEHAAELSKGGELLTFVWLLMAHFGLGDQFQINQGDARAKLIIGK